MKTLDPAERATAWVAAQYYDCPKDPQPGILKCLYQSGDMPKTQILSTDGFDKYCLQQGQKPLSWI